MSEDAEHFYTESALVAKDWKILGNVFVRGDDENLPLYEGKMIHQFDHRFGTYEGQTEAQANQGKLPELDAAQHANPKLLAKPRYWVQKKQVEERLTPIWDRPWLLGWRDITSSVVYRTIIASALPRVGNGDSLLLMFPRGAESAVVALLLANLNSFVCDYAARQKVGGTHLKFHVFKQLPVLPPSEYATTAAWSGAENICSWLFPRLLELIYTAWDMEPFAQDCGYDGPPFCWDEERRFLLRCELDAAFFHFYLPVEKNGDWRPAEGETAEDLARLKASFATPRDAVAYIMDTFPIVRRKDEEKYNGHYRTKRLILEIYDALAESIRTEQPYQTRLEPPPADPRCCHPPRGDRMPPAEPVDAGV